ncbi:MAG: DoxX family membrane protein [Anderseniella sp.]
MRLPTPYQSEALALLLLRIGCAWFIFVWAVNKIFAPVQYQKLAKYFDSIDLGLWQVYAIAGAQILICLLVFVGWARIVSYAALAAMHGFTIFRQWPQYLAPFEINDDGFPVNRNVTVALCAFLAMLALWLLRHRDHWSLDAVLAGRKVKT